MKLAAEHPFFCAIYYFTEPYSTLLKVCALCPRYVRVLHYSITISFGFELLRTTDCSMASCGRGPRERYVVSERKRGPRFMCAVAYDGTDFDGWQTQPNGNGIQDVIEKR